MAELVPQPGLTPIADEYRALVRGIARVDVARDPFRADAYDPVSVASAERRWKKRMVDEYRSTTVFSALMPQLVEANDTLDMTAVVLRMAQDEFRHAELAGQLVVEMGGDNRAEIETAVAPIATHAGACARERAMRNVLVTCLSEMYSVCYFVASLEEMTDPALRTITRALLADEVLHGRFGFHYLDAHASWLETKPDVRASLSRYLRYVFAVCERELIRPWSGCSPGADDAALGLVTEDASREVFHEAMGKAIAPGLERYGLDATRAWRTRSLE